jgi:hypothetical protein
MGSTPYRAGRLAGAEAATREGLRLAPTFVSEHYEPGKILLVEGRVQAALLEMMKEVPEGAQLQGLAMPYRLLGRQAESDAALDKPQRIRQLFVTPKSAEAIDCSMHI